MRQVSPIGAWQVHARSALTEFLFEPPRSLAESYWQHQRRAARFGATLVGAAAVRLTHGLVPGFSAGTSGSPGPSLYEHMVTVRRRPGGVPGLASTMFTGTAAGHDACAAAGSV
jgi:hypothetical protein